MNNKQKEYKVIVGNIGTVYVGDSLTEALRDFNEYVRISDSGIGRAGYETVTLIKGDKILRGWLIEGYEAI